MKKIIVGIIVLTISFMAVSCGPNYTEEFNAAIDQYNNIMDDMEKSDDEVADLFDNADGFADLADAYDVIIQVEKDVLSKCEALLAEIKGYEEGIRDEEAYNNAVKAMEDDIEFLEKDLEDSQAWKQYALIYGEYFQLVLEFEEYSKELEAKDIDEMSNDEYVEMLENGISYMEGEIVKIEDMKKEMSTILVSEDQEDIQDAILEMNDFIQVFNETIETFNGFIEEL